MGTRFWLYSLQVLSIMVLFHACAYRLKSNLQLRPQILRSVLRLRSTSTNSGADGKASKAPGRVSAAVVQAKDDSSNKIEISLAPPKGTRDFYPEDHRLKSWLFGMWRDIARQYGFEEYDAPVVEHVELYIRKAGEEVTQQLYDFQDKSGRRLSLRPEMTPSLARMVLARKNALSFPLKWFSIPQCWRYERMTRGRRREHYQWNMDILGVGGVAAEGELLSAIVTAFQRMGLSEKDVGLKVNSRKLLNDLMSKVGIPTSLHIATCILVDKLEKVSLGDLREEVEKIGVDMKQMEELVELLKLKTLEEYASVLGANAAGVTELTSLFSLMEAYGIADYVTFDPTVVRGLAYYTGVVFEGFDRAGQLRAICGGGRYDQLLANMGGAKGGGEGISAVGFGFGDAVIVELLQMKSLLPDVSKAGTEVLACPLGEEQRPAMMKVVSALRAQGVAVDLVLEEKKAKWAFQRADKMGVRFVLVTGDEEVQGGYVTVKDLKDGKQGRYTLQEVVDMFKNR